jgi:hypothetical protein
MHTKTMIAIAEETSEGRSILHPLRAERPTGGVSAWDDTHETLHLDLSPHTDALDEETRGGFPS